MCSLGEMFVKRGVRYPWVHCIERFLHYKDFTLVAFLDIEEAFNYVSPKSVIESMRQLEVNKTAT